MSDSGKLRLAIVGAGIAGLTCAISLKDCPNIEIDMYEQATQITEIGAGVTLWPRTWDFLKRMGLEKDLLALLREGYNEEEQLAFEFRIADRKEGYTFHRAYTRGGQLPFHRQEIQRTLLKHVPDFARIHLSHRLVRCEEGEDGVKLFFKNGEEATCDVLIAADGIHSVTRENFENEGIFYTGTQVFRGLIPKETLAERYPNHRTINVPTIYCGKDKHIVVYPISGGRIINVVAFFSRVEDEGKQLDGPAIRDATSEEVLAMFEGWEDEIIQLLESIEKPTRWAIQDLRPMKTYISQRIALVGDAAHSMTPHLGAGAGQAMEDAYVLGQLFLRAGAERWPSVLQAYNQVRQPYGNMIQRNARNQGFYYELNAPGFEDIKTIGQELSTGQISLMSNAISTNWSWWADDFEDDLKRGFEALSKGDDSN